MKCPHCGKEVRIRMCLHVQEFPGVKVEDGVTPVVGKAASCEVDILPEDLTVSTWPGKTVDPPMPDEETIRKPMTKAERYRAKNREKLAAKARERRAGK
jgi:hypothetical protein